MESIDFEKTYPFWSDLDDSERVEFRKATGKLTYRAGEIIHQPEHRCEGMIYMLEGTLRIYILSDEGREITLYRLHPV